MSSTWIAASSLPAEPVATADAGTRMIWYATVARWAPSKHNTQPWRFVESKGSLDVWADPLRVLVDTDPHRRELLISCGAAVHLACVAARALGHRPHVRLLPEGRGGPVARIEEVGPWDTSEDDRSLLAAVQHRRTDRGPLDGHSLPASLPFSLQSAASAHGAVLRLVSTVGDRATLADLVTRADRLLVRHGHVDDELTGWLREPDDRRPDGVPTDHTRGAAASYRAEFVQRDFSSIRSQPAPSRSHPDTPVVGVLCTPADRAEDWLVAGQALGAVLLLATVAGAHASYLNQPVEEPSIRVQLRDQLQLDGVAQLILRIGVGSEVTPTPRRDVDEVTFRA